MMYNAERLPLVIEIGQIAAQARFYHWLDEACPIVADAPHENPRYIISSDLWFEALDRVLKLAEMDHRDNFTPKTSPMLLEFGLLKEYWEARDRLNPEPESPYD